MAQLVITVTGPPEWIDQHKTWLVGAIEMRVEQLGVDPDDVVDWDVED